MINEAMLNFDAMDNLFAPRTILNKVAKYPDTVLPEVLFMTSFPPRECGIATYSQDLLKALDNKFNDSFSLKVCALEAGRSNHIYPGEVEYILNTEDATEFVALSNSIIMDQQVKLVVVEHEFGLFRQSGEDAFLQFLYSLNKPVIVAFHTVLPHPGEAMKINVQRIVEACASIIVMTKHAAKILKDDYEVAQEKIVIIPHGTHLVPHLGKDLLKAKYGLSGRKVLSTFGLLNSGKSIETTLDALPAIVAQSPDALFLVIGKTHPSVVLSEGETYRNMLEAKVEELSLQAHVKFINHYLPLADLLEYLQLTDIYLFTSKDRHQAVSGTFSYAMSCGCPVISTPIPHAKEVLRTDTGILIDFQNSEQLAAGVNRLMNDEPLRSAFSESTLQRIVPTAWENSAIAHALLLQRTVGETNDAKTSTNGTRLTEHLNDNIQLQYRLPPINLAHLKKMTTDVGMIQFSKINQPDIDSGYTLDDNARALIAICMHYQLTGDENDINYIRTYLDFIKSCQLPAGYFLNYKDEAQNFTVQNGETNLSDANGRALWALGYLVAKSPLLPVDIIATAVEIVERALPQIETMRSTRAMAFAIKGLYYFNLENKSYKTTELLKTLADRLVQMYRHESEPKWQWFESYLTYANSILPEAMLCAWQETGDIVYKSVAKSTFDFLLSLTFNDKGIKVISNNSWLHKGGQPEQHGEQPIDVAYTILAMKRFYREYRKEDYRHKMTLAFDWFLGNNHLNQIIYNPCTGGCYDGLEKAHVNLNQGAESTLSYLMARMTIEGQSLIKFPVF